MSLKGIAKENNNIISSGEYINASGLLVSVEAATRDAINGSRLYTPQQLDALLDNTTAPERRASTNFRVVDTKTGETARALGTETGRLPLALNFASAKNPGGGYTGGAKAQEEDLARCSALYYTQRKHHQYYDENRRCKSLLYLDYLIYSPRVPFFRDEKYNLLERPEPVSVITCPAPNAGQYLRGEPTGQDKIHHTLQRRAGMVLAVAKDLGYLDLVLGAWGCGVFQNDPTEVATVFKTWLGDDRFVGAFENVVFAVYDRNRESGRRAAFEKVFASV